MRIKLLQRLMAENMTQSEISKRYYLAKLTHRSKPHTRHATSTTPQIRYPERATLHASLVHASTTSQVFKPPERSAYDIYQHTNTFFNADRHKQPLPRSSYNREYMVNPPTRDQLIKPKDTHFIAKTNPAKFLNSSYQLEFSRKERGRGERVELKELDACRDKIMYVIHYFRSLAVLYGRKDRKSLSPDSYNIFLSKLRESGEGGVGREEESGEGRRGGGKGEKRVLLTAKKMLSESRRQYKKNEGCVVSSSIKHQNLHRLKYQYLQRLNS